MFGTTWVGRSPTRTCSPVPIWQKSMHTVITVTGEIGAANDNTATYRDWRKQRIKSGADDGLCQRPTRRKRRRKWSGLQDLSQNYNTFYAYALRVRGQVTRSTPLHSVWNCQQYESWARLLASRKILENLFWGHIPRRSYFDWSRSDWLIRSRVAWVSE